MTARALRLLGLCALLGVGAAACGDGGSHAAASAGRYELDRPDYARRLAAEHLETKDGKPRKGIDAKKRAEIQGACVAKARAIKLSLELRADGAFMARFVDARGEQRLGGQWSQAGAEVTFQTTAVPGGRVTSIPVVRAERTPEGLTFGGAVSGWVVPHAFFLRKVE